VQGQTFVMTDRYPSLQGLSSVHHKGLPSQKAVATEPPWPWMGKAKNA